MICLNKVSLIIPAYNEEKRIADVINPIKDMDLIGEIIVIDDCSKDDTSGVVNNIDSEKIKLIKHTKNKGKTQSMKDGIEASKNDIVLFLDADLSGVNQEDVENLIKPVLDNKVDLTMSIRDNSLKIYKSLKCDFVSGERCLNKEIMSHLWHKISIGFGIEVIMNDYLLKNNMTFVSIPTKFGNTMKSVKRGRIMGFFDEVSMIFQIAKAMPLHKVIHQMFKMSKLSKKYKNELYLE